MDGEDKARLMAERAASNKAFDAQLRANHLGDAASKALDLSRACGAGATDAERIMAAIIFGAQLVADTVEDLGANG